MSQVLYSRQVEVSQSNQKFLYFQNLSRINTLSILSSSSSGFSLIIYNDNKIDTLDSQSVNDYVLTGGSITKIVLQNNSKQMILFDVHLSTNEEVQNKQTKIVMITFLVVISVVIVISVVVFFCYRKKQRIEKEEYESDIQVMKMVNQRQIRENFSDISDFEQNERNIFKGQRQPNGEFNQ